MRLRLITGVAFDAIDSLVSLEPETQLFDQLYAAVTCRCEFTSKEAVRAFFAKMTGFFKNMNNAATSSFEFQRFSGERDALKHSVPATRARFARYDRSTTSTIEQKSHATFR